MVIHHITYYGFLLYVVVVGLPLLVSSVDNIYIHIIYNVPFLL